MKNIKYLLFILLLIFNLNPLISQSIINKDTIFKPYYAGIYAYGGFGVLFIAAGVNGQYKIRQYDSFSHSGLWLNTGIGASTGINHLAKTVSLKIDYLKGRNNHYFELSGGLLVGSYSYQQYLEPKFRIYPDVNIGYRYQNNWSPFFMRMGIGYPEYAFFSLGVSFYSKSL